MFDRMRRAARLGYLVGRAVLHVLVEPLVVGEYCAACGSMLVRREGAVIVLGDTPCPVHVAIRELARSPLPRARSRS